MEPRIPTALGVGLWLASGLAVLTYTFVAFKETATGVEAAGLVIGEAASPLVAIPGVLAAEVTPSQPTKQLNRNRFKPSR